MDKRFILLEPGFGSIADIPGFDEGWFWVQEPSQGFINDLAVNKSSKQVLDICAAPGGKSIGISFTNPDFHVAVDRSKLRMKLMIDNLSRLDLININLIIADSTRLPFSHRFDSILADVPCTSYGIMNRHPEIRWRIQPEGINKYAEIGYSLLLVASDYVKPGGSIIYSTCTLNSEENEDVINKFMQKHDEYKLGNIEEFVSKEFINKSGFIEVLPEIHEVDGAFAAKLVRISQ